MGGIYSQEPKSSTEFCLVLKQQIKHSARFLCLGVSPRKVPILVSALRLQTGRVAQPSPALAPAQRTLSQGAGPELGAPRHNALLGDARVAEARQLASPCPAHGFLSEHEHRRAILRAPGRGASASPGRPARVTTESRTQVGVGGHVPRAPNGPPGPRPGSLGSALSTPAHLCDF